MLSYRIASFARARVSSLSLALLATLGASCAGEGERDDAVTPAVFPCTPLPAIRETVKRQGSELWADGRRVRAVGANVYYLQQMLAYAQQGNDETARRQALDALDDLVCMSIPVVRTTAFNDTQDSASIRTAPGQYREEGLRALDQAVAEAKARGIRLVMMLTNNHADYGGLPAYAQWAGKAKDDFFTDAAMKQYWKDYASMLLNRVNSLTAVAYKDEPAILAWEVGNEMRCPSCGSSEPLVATVRELAGHLKQLGATQLVADGGEGFDDVPGAWSGLSNRYPIAGAEGSSFSKLVQAPELDLVSYHFYPRSWGLKPSSDADVWIDRHEALARAAGKLAYLGEFGFIPTANADRERAAKYDDWMARLFRAQDGSMSVVWQVVPLSRAASSDDGYGVQYGRDHSTVRVLQRWSHPFLPVEGLHMPATAKQ